MAAPKKPAPSFSITVTLDESLLTTIENISNALARIADSMGGQEVSVTDPETVPAELKTEPMPQQPLTIPATTEEAIAGLKEQYNMGAPVTNLSTPVMNPPVQEAPQQIASPLQIPNGYVPPVQQPQQVPMTAMPPVQPQQMMQAPAQTIPTSAPVYSLEQLMQACAQLMDKGAPPYDLFQKYGIQMLTELNPENYGLFATDLRAKGAQI